MRKFLLLLALLATGSSALAGPMDDREELLAHYKKILPDIKFENYIYGSLSMNPGGEEPVRRLHVVPVLFDGS